ncbi:hypothetical protein [Pendulispora albinea]|uniref:Uncharacterized protein n=1 Tax=Pendulispora albinea TaxID=2741071 RepID=A0ABZ2MAS9_9BACT
MSTHRPNDSSAPMGPATTLFVREGDRLVEAPAEDVALARAYPRWPDKGAVAGGRRLTLLCAERPYAAGETVHVIHAVEYVGTGHTAYVMGPKPVVGEWVDGSLATAPAPAPSGGDPLVPRDYDGLTLPSPIVDIHYEITTYRFVRPGTHDIVWRLGPDLQSNVLRVQVR